MEEAILNKLNKILELAERGVGGEKTSAEKLFEKYAKQHGVTKESLKQQKKKKVIYKIEDEFDKQLLLQVLSKVSNKIVVPECKIIKEEVGWIIGVMLTPLQRAEVETMFTVYVKALRKDLNILTKAFIYSNDILAEEAVSADTLSDEAQEELKRIKTMMKEVQKVEVKKQIKGE